LTSSQHPSSVRFTILLRCHYPLQSSLCSTDRHRSHAISSVVSENCAIPFRTRSGSPAPRWTPQTRTARGGTGAPDTDSRQPPARARAPGRYVAPGLLGSLLHLLVTHRVSLHAGVARTPRTAGWATPAAPLGQLAQSRHDSTPGHGHGGIATRPRPCGAVAPSIATQPTHKA